MAVRMSTIVSVVLPAALWCFAGAGPESAVAKRVVIGTSVQKRPIVAWAFGPDNARRKILVVGCIHGNECAGLAITSALRRSRLPKGVQLWLVPEMNPDGTAVDDVTFFFGMPGRAPRGVRVRGLTGTIRTFDPADDEAFLP